MPPQILQVDDLRANRLLLAKALEPLGVTLADADSGADALDRLASRAFDLIILDVHLPDMTGFEVARRVRADASGPNRETPILFISAEHQALGDMLAGYEIGAVDYLLRPVPPVILRGKVAALCAIQRDKRRIAEQRDEIALKNGALERALAAREESEQRYRALLDHSPQGILVEADGAIVYHNRVALDLLGYSAAEGLGARGVPDLATPDCRAAVAEHLSRARDGEPGGTLEARLFRRDGSTVVVELRAAAVPFGVRAGVQVFLQDLEKIREAQDDLLRVRAALEGARDGVVITDAHGQPIFVNIAFGTLFGHTLASLRQSGLETAYADPSQARDLVFRVLQAEELDEEAEMVDRRGGRLTVMVRGSVVMDDAYRLVGATLVHTDITRRKRLEDELRALSQEDALTGVPNRRAFDERLAAEWARARRRRAPIAVAMIDIDAFKPYNDGNGHQAGDDCLRAVAQVLAGACRRPGELLARYGGEEFAVVFPDTGAEEAARIAEALRAAVEARNLPHGHSPVAPHITVSVGVATVIPSRAGNPDAVIRMADRALYSAKAAGRNRTALGAEPPESR